MMTVETQRGQARPSSQPNPKPIGSRGSPFLTSPCSPRPAITGFPPWVPWGPKITHPAPMAQSGGPRPVCDAGLPVFQMSTGSLSLGPCPATCPRRSGERLVSGGGPGPQTLSPSPSASAWGSLRARPGLLTQNVGVGPVPALQGTVLYTTVEGWLCRFPPRPFAPLGLWAGETRLDRSRCRPAGGVLCRGSSERGEAAGDVRAAESRVGRRAQGPRAHQHGASQDGAGPGRGAAAGLRGRPHRGQPAGGLQRGRAARPPCPPPHTPSPGPEPHSTASRSRASQPCDLGLPRGPLTPHGLVRQVLWVSPLYRCGHGGLQRVDGSPQVTPQEVVGPLFEPRLADTKAPSKL